MATLYIVLEGTVLKAEGFEWADYLFPSLYNICQRGVYNLVLLLEQEYPTEVSEKVLTTLSNQGIAIDEAIQLKAFQGAPQGHRGYLLSKDPQVIAEKYNLEAVKVVDWREVATFLGDNQERPLRRSEVVRETRETSIDLRLNLDGSGKTHLATGLPFFDHMLDQIVRHGRLDLTLEVKGDLKIDEHHTVEDVGLVLGQAVKEALGDKRGINRYGFELVAMDECLAQVALDFSGRNAFVWSVEFKREMVGTFPTEMVEHFFKSFSDEAKCALHMKVSSGNTHHQIEALFKAFGRAVRKALLRYPGNWDLPSTKGVL
ncbi:MAG: imidazoleglycerol-phosphate dehydratase HisB [Sphaerochaetaceae bacterium]